MKTRIIDKKSPSVISRRSVLGMGVAGGALLPMASIKSVAAENKKIGNYPESVRGDSVFVGLTLPLTGPFSLEGTDQLKGYELAIEQINTGSDEIKKISPLTTKGVLGKTIKYRAFDVESKANSAVQAASNFIHKDKAIMISGSVSSSVAIALEKYCDREKALYLVGISGSNDTTGKDCQRYAFRVWTGGHAVAQAIAPIAAKTFGKNCKAIYSVPDYSWGHTMYDSVRTFTEQEGWTTIGQQVHALGTKDFSTYLINIANSDADVLVVLDYGADAASLIKQAKQFGILDKMKLVVPWMDGYLGERVGPELISNVFGAMCFWWTLEDRYPIAKDFVGAFRKKFGVIPHDPAFIGYMNIALWADAVERAGSFYPPDVIKSFEQEVRRPSPVGELWMRKEDHQGIINFPIVMGKNAADMKSPEDVFEIISVVNGADVAPPLGLFNCKLGSYT